MIYKTIARTAIISILRNKTRSFLTTLGVIIGVLSVILLTAIGNGLTEFVEEQFQNLGSNLLIVAPGEFISEEGGFNAESASLSLAQSKLSLTDVRTLERIGPPITSVVTVLEATAEVRSNQGKRQGFVLASHADYTYLRNTKPVKGRFYTNSEVSGNRKVVVIGSKIEEKLFAGEEPVGKTLTINRVKFEIIGVAESKGGGSFGPDIDSAIYMPITTARTALGFDKISYHLIQVDEEENIPLAKERLKSSMLKILKEDEFSITDQSEILSTIQTILGTLTLALSGIAAISLVVGGIGIMNIMLVAVSERTREIGLRKALGATPRNILVQFLIESAVLSTLGGLIGIVLGVIGSLAIQRFFPATPAISSILLAFGVSLVTGIVFGVVPARKASRLSPIEALRYE